jgi:ArsR family transcriptional regulator, arsenate/arsenite/antimonite-responsive transcriptional repressor
LIFKAMTEQMSIAYLCCSPVLDGPLPEADATQLAMGLKVLADPTRLRILGLIRQSPGRRTRTRDLVDELDLTQPTVSHHLGALFDAGFLSREHEGRQTWYAIVPASFEAVCQAFSLDKVGA